MDELKILTECALFRGLRRAQIQDMLPCLSARRSRFRRGQFLLRSVRSRPSRCIFESSADMALRLTDR